MAERNPSPAADAERNPSPAADAEKHDGSSEGVTEGILAALQELVSNPLNLVLLSISFYLLYKIYKDYFKKEEPRVPRPPPLPKMVKRDFTLQELRPYDGSPTAPEGRVLIAVNGKVFDVTRGKGFYGPGGPYDVFAGRDGSRGLGTFALDAPASDAYDDLSDLTIDQMNQVREWEAQFEEKYDLVGRLLKPGEVAHDYALDEEESAAEETATIVRDASPKTSPAAKKTE
ncbi:putative Membrane-associated progesterone receptor component 2 [Hypsibius exemplaris]|uniref:Membrane-associated progesterone receptor component 2 n=1 Tax=Hypsibius exemplaris TaxID=2072580 RepID=A0A9X6NKJ5_HYPEX|nr:putative Membrane-associated progesterone receptor component 2 [Hypsibius exemplaris]